MISPAFTPPESLEEDEQTIALRLAELNVRLRVLKKTAAKLYTYTLLLQEGCVYVGNTDNIYLRLVDHFGMTASSSQWVRAMGPVVRVMEIIRSTDDDDELAKTMEWVDLLGPEKVRGSTYCRVDARHPPSSFAGYKRDGSRRYEYMSRAEIDGVVRHVRSLVSKLKTPSRASESTTTTPECPSSS